MDERVSEYPGLFELIWRSGRFDRPERRHNIYLPFGHQIHRHGHGQRPLDRCTHDPLFRLQLLTLQL